MNAPPDGHPDWIELDARSGEGLDVALLWRRADGAVAVRVLDTTSGAARGALVPGACAADAFAHPYAYLSAPQRAAALDPLALDVDELWLAELGAEVIADLAALLARIPRDFGLDGEEGV